jgi:catechol 2,3-dioxygenase-like lactoylglutathione lyase family enzyme
MRRGSVNHLRLTVADVPASKRFYDPLMRLLGYGRREEEPGRVAYGREDAAGGVLWLILTGASPELRAHPHQMLAPGLHHLAFNAEDRAEVDRVHELLVAADAHVLDPPAEYDYEPGYYAVFFRDPDGFKLEVVHVPS